jgi:hypothetical protein
VTQKQVKFTPQTEINALPYQVIAPDITGVRTDTPYFNMKNNVCYEKVSLEVTRHSTNSLGIHTLF